jgi:hypothetical protein
VNLPSVMHGRRQLVGDGGAQGMQPPACASTSAGLGATGGAQPAAGHPRGAAVSAGASNSVSGGGLRLPVQAAAPREACVVCAASPMTKPWGARCGHLACWACWAKALARAHACPKCGAPTQRHLLTEKFFH